MRKGFCCALLVLLCLAVASAQVVRPGSQTMRPDGKGGVVPAAPGELSNGPTGDSVHQGNGINYHGGPIMPNTPNIYLIFYGKWKNGAHASDSPATKKLVKQFVTGISGSGYEMINSTYGDNNFDVTGLVSLAGNSSEAYPFGSTISDSGVQQAVAKKINNGTFPLDTNGLYFVITSSDVVNPGFCSSFCGWHTHGTINGKDIKYSWVGNPDRCITSCAQQSPGPNNNSGGDGLVNIIAHEMEEAISDPDLNAWWMTSGAENADACAWRFGTLLGGSFGAGNAYNETFGGHNWLLQMNWENNRGGGCDNFLGGPFH